MQTLRSLEARFFQALNGFVEPAVRAGIGSPCLTPNGLIVLETTGRRSGRTYRTPLLVTVLGGRIFASSVRGESSQWLKNLASTPMARYWLGGRLHDADAAVFAPNAPLPDFDTAPALLRPILPVASLFGIGVAVLTPRAGPAVGIL